ncbi:MAG: peptidylprolyl isomerase [Bacteroidetes bacterium GWF2_43_63]|nr:MAG: peptidylprolyl isomerase [Bacteroidetes bacterium GWE2_42_42]OFY52730.1 MAG: peptidylprolyl isomerase [Bacteroidetes bacterium GWF2_43_63]HCB61149.1 peptidylprolyl isomerase [Bacteroidales bacterium]HCY23811.1 peptidylprolyl isomerase [Bacteroidales bacterium]
MKKILTLFVFLSVITTLATAQQVPEGTKVQISTSLGDIKIVLYNNTPQHRDNFIKLVQDEFFDGIIFHRVITGFMIQGGDPDSKNAKPKQALGSGGPGYDIPMEYNAANYHKRGALAAAREGDDVNPQKASSGSQFYIVTGRLFTDKEISSIEKRRGFTYTEEQKETYRTIGGYAPLDKEYTVFGEVYEGMDVVEAISKVARDENDRPLEDIEMTVTIISAE